jgi:hypothetical protein
MSNNLRRLLFVIVIAGFILGLVNLIWMRLEGGEAYSHYSSLRADPLGTKVLYRAMEEISTVIVSRNYRSPEELRGNVNMSFIVAGLNSGSSFLIQDREVHALETIAMEGGRIILLLHPRSERFLTQKAFGLSFGALINSSEIEHSIAVSSHRELDLPQNIGWHDNTYFTETPEYWTSIYELNGYPVIIERSMGKGSIVIATDSYLFSNEAMQKQRQPKLVSWILGGRRQVIFDEYHLGVIKNKGISSLVRKYDLYGVLVALLALAALFIWKNSTSLVPAVSVKDEDSYVSDMDHCSGIVSLLKRNIPNDEIIDACLKEWNKSTQDGDELLFEQVIENPLDTKLTRNPVDAYYEISKKISERPL